MEYAHHLDPVVEREVEDQVILEPADAPPANAGESWILKLRRYAHSRHMGELLKRFVRRSEEAQRGGFVVGSDVVETSRSRSAASRTMTWRAIRFSAVVETVTGPGLPV